MPKITPLHWKKFEKFLLYVGCVFERQRGDHRIYNRPGLKRPVVLTTDAQVPVDHITSNLRTLSIGHNEYLEILKKL